MKTNTQKVGRASASGKSNLQLQPGPIVTAADEQTFIRTHGHVVEPRPFLPEDIYQGAGLDDPRMLRDDIALLNLAWPSETAPHLYAADCMALWGLTDRRTNYTLLRMRQRGWIEMWRLSRTYTYHILPAGAALLVTTAADAVRPPGSPDDYEPGEGPDDEPGAPEQALLPATPNPDIPETPPAESRWQRGQLSGFDLFNLIFEMDDEERSCIAMAEVEAALRKETTFLGPRDFLYAVKILSERIYCTVCRDVTSLTHISGSLRLVVVTLGADDEIKWKKVISLPLLTFSGMDFPELVFDAFESVIKPAIEWMAEHQNSYGGKGAGIASPMITCHHEASRRPYPRR